MVSLSFCLKDININISYTITLLVLFFQHVYMSKKVFCQFWKIVLLGIKFWLAFFLQYFKMLLHCFQLKLFAREICCPYLCSSICNVSFSFCLLLNFSLLPLLCHLIMMYHGVVFMVCVCACVHTCMSVHTCMPMHTWIHLISWMFHFFIRFENFSVIISLNFFLSCPLFQGLQSHIY